MPTVKWLIEHLQEGYNPTDVIAYDLWVVSDVKDRAQGLGLEITDEQAAEILEEVDHHKDASLGINWDTIDVHIYELVHATRNKP